MTISAVVSGAFEQGFEVPDGARGVRIDMYPALLVSYMDDEGNKIRSATYCPREGTNIATMDDVKAQIASEVAIMEKRATAPPAPLPPDSIAVAAKIAEWDAKRGESVDTVENAEADIAEEIIS